MMKTRPSQRARQRPAPAHDHDEIVILLPNLHVLQLVARSVLLAAALISFPWLRPMLAAWGGGAATQESDPNWVDSPFNLRMLVADLKREGLFNSDLRNLFLGDPGSRVAFLKRNQMDLISSEYMRFIVEDNSVDFVLAANVLKDPELAFVDRVLKVGGIVAVGLGSDPKNPFKLPANYRMVYIRRFGSTIVAIKKISHGNACQFKSDLRSRRLLLVAKRNEKEKKTMYLQEVFIAQLIEKDCVRWFVEGAKGMAKWFTMKKCALDAHLFEKDYARWAVDGAKGMWKWLAMKKAEAEAESETNAMADMEKCAVDVNGKVGVEAEPNSMAEMRKCALDARLFEEDNPHWFVEGVKGMAKWFAVTTAEAKFNAMAEMKKCALGVLLFEKDYSNWFVGLKGMAKWSGMKTAETEVETDEIATTRKT